MENKRNKIELGDIFRKYGDVFLENHQLCPVQLKAIEAICYQKLKLHSFRQLILHRKRKIRMHNFRQI